MLPSLWLACFGVVSCIGFISPCLFFGYLGGVEGLGQRSSLLGYLTGVEGVAGPRCRVGPLRGLVGLSTRGGGAGDFCLCVVQAFYLACWGGGVCAVLGFGLTHLGVRAGGLVPGVVRK